MGVLGGEEREQDIENLFEALQTTMHRSHPFPSMVNPTMFFNITIASKPLGPISFELFLDKVPETAEIFLDLSTGENRFGYKGPCFRRTIPGFTCKGFMFTATMAQAGSPPMGRNLMMIISS